jgi:hypothetical protein
MKKFNYTRPDRFNAAHTDFEIDQRMFEQDRALNNQDERVKRRLEQQNAWLARRKEEKNRREAVNQQLLAIRAHN